MALHAARSHRGIAAGIAAPSWVASPVSFAVVAGKNRGATSAKPRLVAIVEDLA